MGHYRPFQRRWSPITAAAVSVGVDADHRPIPSRRRLRRTETAMYSSHITHELARARINDQIAYAEAYRLAAAARQARPARRRRTAIPAAPMRMFAGTAI